MLTDFPLISIVIPCFRAEKFLSQTLETVARQSYPHWELLVVEDGSQDSTESIVKNFQSKNPTKDVRYFRLDKTRGPSAARNEGIRNSKGVWVAFLDSDDLWKPEHLKTLLACAEKKSSDLCYCSVDFFDSESGNVLGLWGPTEDDLECFPETLYLRNFILPSGVMVKKASLEEKAFDEAPEIQSCEDHDLWMTMLRRGSSFSWTPDIKVSYRKNHPGAATSNRERMFRADLAVMYRHLRNPSFGFRTKCKGLSQNYALLAEALLEKKKWKALPYYLKSWFFNPLELSRPKRFLKALGLLSLRSAD
ncbi:glycosyltransferase family 2 protein [bacterium]|nr:glycosyltransferase family 2 protein [bacterium]